MDTTEIWDALAAKWGGAPRPTLVLVDGTWHRAASPVHYQTEDTGRCERRVGRLITLCGLRVTAPVMLYHSYTWPTERAGRAHCAACRSVEELP